MTVFQPFRRLLAALARLEDAVATLSAALRALCKAQEETGPAIGRLDALERAHHQFEALCEGLLMKAEGKLRSANNAEARTRADKKSYEHLLDPLPEDGVEVIQTTAGPVRVHDDPPSEEERVSALRLDVAPSNKTLAQRAKFGVR